MAIRDRMTPSCGTPLTIGADLRFRRKADDAAAWARRTRTHSVAVSPTPLRTGGTAPDTFELTSQFKHSPRRGRIVDSTPRGAAVTARGFGVKGPRGWAFRNIDIAAAPGSLIAVQG